MPHSFPHNTIGLPFIELQSVDSTNNYARQFLEANRLTNRVDIQTGEPVLTLHGTAIFAHEQTSGKGQRGKQWLSEKGANIALSLILDTNNMAISQQFELSATIAVAAREFFDRYTAGDTAIKWPNDLYWRDRKAGGILIETIISGGGDNSNSRANWDWAITGIGININQAVFDPALPNPVSLKQITGKEYDPALLAKELCKTIDGKLTLLYTTGFREIYDQYLAHLYGRNKTVKLKKGNRVFDAMIKTVLPGGKLVIEHSVEEEVDFGEVEWITR